MQFIDDGTPHAFLPAASAALAHTFRMPTTGAADRTRRQPAGIYAISLTQVVLRFARVLTALDALSLAVDRSAGLDQLSTDDLVEALDALLDALIEHVEDCLGIGKSFFGSDALAKQSLAFRQFTNNLEPIRRYLAHRVNHLKHHHGRIRAVVADSSGEFYLGFFFEGMNGNGAVGPDPEIHKRVQAHSFARELRYYVYLTFRTGRCLAELVPQVSLSTGKLPAAGAEVSQRLVAVVEAVSRLPRLVLPGETRLEWPEVTVETVNGVRRADVSLLDGGGAQVTELPRGAHVTVRYVSDGLPGQKFLMPWKG